MLKDLCKYFLASTFSKRIITGSYHCGSRVGAIITYNYNPRARQQKTHNLYIINFSEILLPRSAGSSCFNITENAARPPCTERSIMPATKIRRVPDISPGAIFIAAQTMPHQKTPKQRPFLAIKKVQKQIVALWVTP